MMIGEHKAATGGRASGGATTGRGFMSGKQAISSRCVNHLDFAQDAIPQIRADGVFREKIDFPAKRGGKLSLQSRKIEQALTLPEFYEQVDIAVRRSFSTSHRAKYTERYHRIITANID
jgi:hypothetical protein